MDPERAIGPHIVHSIELTHGEEDEVGVKLHFDLFLLCGLLAQTVWSYTWDDLAMLDELGESYDPFLPGDHIEIVETEDGGMQVQPFNPNQEGGE